MNERASYRGTIQRTDGSSLRLQSAETQKAALQSKKNSKSPDKTSPAIFPIADKENGGSRIPAKQPSILIVDDDSPVRLFIRSALERWGYQVQLASSGNKAKTMIDRNVFDLILTDVMMQDGDGLTLLDWVGEKQPGLPVVMVSAASDIQIAVESMHRGACDYLVKPFDHQKLFETVRRALQKRLEISESRAYQRTLKQELRIRTDMLRWAVDDLQRTHNLMLLALSDALDLRDSETEGHSRRVTGYSITLARALKLTPAEIKVLAQGALLHDVGKIAVPDAILRKPSKLSMKEQEIMRTHCARGYEMLCRIPFLSEASEIVRAHHERFDGSGYPRGLSGNTISIGARIFAVADTLDAITSDRSYKRARTFEEAREDIQSCSGGQFDPEVVKAFMEIGCETWLEVRAQTMGDEKCDVFLREVLLSLPDFSGLQDLIAGSFSGTRSREIY
jgi:putative nucleotidyltransferase with HDIG domain